MQEIIIIAAMSENRIIGRDNRLPWSIKEDLTRFRSLTKGHPCIMGRRTWESLPKRPLPGRLNLVVSRTLREEGAVVFQGLAPAVQFCRDMQAANDQRADYTKVFICGGETVYREALPLSGVIELTLIHGNFEGDAFFPPVDPLQWQESAREDHDSFSFITLRRSNTV